MTLKPLHVLHVAAENGSLPGAKEGGVGDVMRELPSALANAGCRVTTLIPSHGYLHRMPGAEKADTVAFLFRGEATRATLHVVPGHPPHGQVRHLVLHHPMLDAYDAVQGRHRIYVHDQPQEPFCSDGNRFACFCAAAAAVVDAWEEDAPDVLHLHDWHTALVALLAQTAPGLLHTLHTVFSIHNIGVQGVRPLSGHFSSLEAWFPSLPYFWMDVADPVRPACVNLMATGIRLADRVHTVSPSYAEEIAVPSRKPHFFGAEGLERVVAYVRDAGRLIGILNGCDYPAQLPPPPDPADWCRTLQEEIVHWTSGHAALPARHFTAWHRLMELGRQAHPPDTILTTVGRAVDQKLRLLREPGSNGLTALEQILEMLGDRGVWLLLASGDSGYEAYLAAAAARHDNFIFLNGYSERCADLLYAVGHLFVMPSAFEPCGISQMLAMRRGCPCVVHHVGGLRDTVAAGRNGFAFQGWTVTEQVDRLVETTGQALALQRENGPRWRDIQQHARQARFEWSTAAERYRDFLYQPPGSPGGAGRKKTPCR